MATDTSNTSTDETSGDTSSTGTETGQQEQQTSGTGTTDETSGQGQQQASTPEKLPDDHPLVKSLAAQKAEIAAQKTELAEARAQAAKATKLETDLAARPTQEALDTLQSRYDRLEGFLQAIGGPVSKALDSRTFTKELFETDKDIKEIVKDFSAANPSATSTALAAGGAKPADGKVDPNVLLRAAMKPQG